jgi:hypothetical protein
VEAFAMTQHDTTSFKKVAVLTGLTVLVGGAEISSAATLVQDQFFPPLNGPADSTTLNFNQFNPSLGTLQQVQIQLTSQIFEAVGVNVFAQVSGQSFFINFAGPLAFSPTSFGTITFPIGAPFIGAGILPYGLQYSAACGEGTGQPACGEGWSGDLKITYTYDQPNNVPLPAALPLFASGAAGLGFLGWLRRFRQKTKKQA